MLPSHTHATPSSHPPPPPTASDPQSANAPHQAGASKPGGPKLKLKIASQDKNPTSRLEPYLQGYDRELDSDQEEASVAFEEQFILKMPPGPECDQLRELVNQRVDFAVHDAKVHMKFKDSRRGIFSIGGKTFGMKLVDLPCVIESQKTFDNKHLFKIADICQMILVDDTPLADESTMAQGNFNIEDFIYPHGLTPPLHHVRKRRFRKRLNKRTIETVERAVERLLEEDSRADQVIIDIVDNVRDLSDSEGEDYQPPRSATVAFGNLPPSKIVYNKPRPSVSAGKRSSSQPLDPTSAASDERPRETRPHGPDDGDVTAETPVADSLGMQTPAADPDEFEDRGMNDYDDDEGSIDSDLAAEIEAGLMEGAAAEERAAAGLTGPEDGDEDSEDLFGNGEGDEEEEEEEEEEDDDEDDDDEEESNETVEEKQRVRLLQGELKDLEAAISRKKGEIAKAANLILRKRFEEALKKLSVELESKKAQLNSTQLNLQNAAKERKTRQERQEQERADDEATKTRSPRGGEVSLNENQDSQTVASLPAGRRELEVIEEITESQSRTASELLGPFQEDIQHPDALVDSSMDIDVLM